MRFVKDGLKRAEGTYSVVSSSVRLNNPTWFLLNQKCFGAESKRDGIECKIMNYTDYCVSFMDNGTTLASIPGTHFINYAHSRISKVLAE